MFASFNEHRNWRQSCAVVLGGFRFVRPPAIPKLKNGGASNLGVRDFQERISFNRKHVQHASVE